jgi:hypothetical protein
MIDDVHVHGQAVEEHNESVFAVLERIKQAGKGYVKC